MSWYIILFLICLCFFIIKTLISFFAGDTDIDFDVDGDIDFDIKINDEMQKHNIQM